MRLRVEELESRTTPTLAYSGGGEITNDLEFGLHPYEGFTGQINLSVVETAPPTESSLSYDYLAIPGPGGGPRLVVGDWSGNIRYNAFVFDEGFRGGVNIDASKEYIVLGAMEGGGPRVEVLDAKTFGVISDFFAYDPGFRGGVNVALEGTGADTRIVVGPGVGGGPNVRTFDLHGALLTSFLVDTDSPRGGTQVTEVRGNVVTLSGHLLTMYSDTGVRTGNEGEVPASVRSLGRGYYTNNLVATVTLGTSGGDELEYDLNPLFPTPRLITDLHLFDRPVQLGNVDQLDGVARFDLTFGLSRLTNVTSMSFLDNKEFPLGKSVSPTPGAYAIGELDGGTGTLTGYVQDASGQVYGLTNHHVVTDLKGDTQVGKLVYQPGPAFDNPTPFGNVTAWTPAVDGSLNDSALIKVATFDNRTAYTDFNANVGYIQAHGTGTVKVGDLVYKFGFWGDKMGLVVATNQTIRVTYENGQVVSFPGQIVVASAENGIEWVIPGDSGSLVISYDGTRVAQVFAGSTIAGIASPIQNVESSLGVHFMG